MTALSMLRLPAERIDQLKTLTAALGLHSTADTVGHLIREQAARNVIPDFIPGFRIVGDGDVVSIAVDDGVPTRYSRATAAKIVATICDVADGKASGLASLADNFIVMRQGKGVRLHFPLTAPAKSVSPDIARDIARLMEKAA